MANNVQAIYKPGSLNIETFTNENGKVAFSKGQTVEEYLFEHKDNDLIVLPFKDAMELIEMEHDKMSCQSWGEISEDTYISCLECLPPSRWTRVKGVEFFQSPEMWSFNITNTYASYNGKFYSALRKTSCDYAVLADEIKKL